MEKRRAFFYALFYFDNESVIQPTPSDLLNP